MNTLSLYVIISTILSILSLGIVVWMFISGKRLYSAYIMKILIVFLIVISPCIAQERNDTVLVDRPLVIGIPDGVKAADNAIKSGVDYLIEDDLWRQSAYEFLYGDMSVGANVNLTNLVDKTNISA
jgi:hypothetical protein